VRDFFIGNALYWLREYHLDGLRLDATHAIKDDSEVRFLQELAEQVRASTASERHVVLIAEDERNERRLVTPRDKGGYGLDAVWADDLHHQIRRALAGDQEGYYRDYSGSTRDIARTLERGWFYEGQYSEYLDEKRGSPASGLPYPAFVHCIQNHDQIGNRALGARLNHDISLAGYRAASTLLLLDPATPLLFMGQEWAASTPFLFFTDFEEELGHLVTEGRREEFKGFAAFSDEQLRESIPDPQTRETFLRSRLIWEECDQAPHDGVLRLYRDLLAMRRDFPPAARNDRAHVVARALGADTVVLRRACKGGVLLLVVCNLRGILAWELNRDILTKGSAWELQLSSEAAVYGGAGDPAISLEDDRLCIRGPGAAVLLGR
jgi:maltooligosyltrehalose trehalohydrolase